MDRRGRLLGGISPALSTGLEIGALHSPLIPREEGRVRYVDYAPAETLRANFRHPNANAADIVEVDIIWGERPLRDCLQEPVDYIVASHVIEHVPNLVGWLLELHAALKPGGVLGLAVPDRRNTFDIRRPVSTPGEMIEAWLCHYSRPSLRQVFDAAALSKDTAEPEDLYPDGSVRGLPGEVLRRLPLALDLVKGMVAEQRYVDVHCWVFTPASFLDTAEALCAMGCFPYVVEGFFPTEPGSIEFHVRLRTVADATDPSIARSIASFREIPTGGEINRREGAGAAPKHGLRQALHAVRRAIRG